MKMESKYKLKDGVRIYFNGDNEIRFRKGIWNYEEAVLDVNFFDEGIRPAVIEIFNDLSKGKDADLAPYHAKYSLNSDETGTLHDLMRQLLEQNFLSDGADQDLSEIVKSLIGGTASLGFGEGKGRTLRPVMAICDTAAMKEYIMMLAEQTGLPVTVMNEEDVNRISQANLTDKLEALPTLASLNEFKMILALYCCVMVSLERPRVKLLRNLNRILLALNIPMTLAMLDGPFLSVMTIKGYETGCFECFENRVMARLEDMSAYKNFVEKEGGMISVTDKTFTTPILQSIASSAFFDALLISTINKAKLAGRVLNIYLPLLEIQTQDLLRTPFCSACGHIAKAQYDEMYTSSKKIVDNMVQKISITKG